MLKDKNEYCQAAGNWVEEFANKWLASIPHWSPVVVDGASKVSSFSFQGKFKVVANSDINSSSGQCIPTCSNKSQAKHKVNLFHENWVCYPNQAQREKIFETIKNHHQRFRSTSHELDRAVEKWMEDCSSCNGRGHNPCSPCNSSGKVTCKTCHGRRQVRCSVCHGSKGRHVTVNSYNKGWENCSVCYGSGEQRCRVCDMGGQQTCGNCNGGQVIDCAPCRASGAFTHTLTGYASLESSYDFQIADLEESFDALVSEVSSYGLRGILPGFDLAEAMEWENNLIMNEVKVGTYEADFDGKLPFYFVDMKPDQEFGGPKTTTIFAGATFSPISLGYILDTTVNSLVEHGSRDINKGRVDIAKWTSSKLGNEVHVASLNGEKSTSESLAAISENVKHKLLSAYDHVSRQLTDPTNSIPVGRMGLKAIKYSALLYMVLVFLGSAVIMFSAKHYAPYAINWDVFGFVPLAHSTALFAMSTIEGAFFTHFRASELLSAQLIVAASLLMVMKFYFTGPKPWSGARKFWSFLFAYLISGGIVVVAEFYLPKEAYFVFPDDYSVSFVSALFSELIGVVVMIPEILMLAAAIAYLRIRKSQDDDIRVALDEIGSDSLKKTLGYARN